MTVYNRYKQHVLSIDRHLRPEHSLYARLFLPMDHTETLPDLELEDILQDLREKTLPELEVLALDLLPADAIPTQYVNTLDEKHKTIALRASLLVYYASKCRIVPRQYQLEANNGLEDGLEVIVDSGTGSGKTLCQIIPNLLHPNTTSMTISPLKRLQILQVASFDLISRPSSRCYF